MGLDSFIISLLLYIFVHVDSVTSRLGSWVPRKGMVSASLSTFTSTEESRSRARANPAGVPADHVFLRSIPEASPKFPVPTDRDTFSQATQSANTFSDKDYDRARGARLFKSLGGGHGGIEYEHLTSPKYLGRGGYGEVSCWNLGKTEEEVAVKRGEQLALYREARIYKILEEHPHPAVLKFYGLVPVEKISKWVSWIPFVEEQVLVMEKAKGKSIYYVNYEDSSTKRSILQQLFSVLAHLSSLGISHEDLHDGNMLYDVDTQQLKVIDFGIGRIGSKAGMKEDLTYAMGIASCILGAGCLSLHSRIPPSTEEGIDRVLSQVCLSSPAKHLLKTLMLNYDNPNTAYTLAAKEGWMLDTRSERELTRIIPHDLSRLSSSNFKQVANRLPRASYPSNEYRLTALSIPLPSPSDAMIKLYYPCSNTAEGEVKEILRSLPSQVAQYEVSSSASSYISVLTKLAGSPPLPGLPFVYSELTRGEGTVDFLAESFEADGHRESLLETLYSKHEHPQFQHITPKAVASLALGLTRVDRSLAKIESYAESLSPEELYLRVRDLYFMRQPLKKFYVEAVQLVDLKGVRDGEGDSGPAMGGLLLRLGGIKGALPSTYEDAAAAVKTSSLEGKSKEMVLSLYDPDLTRAEKIEKVETIAQDILCEMNAKWDQREGTIVDLQQYDGSE